MSSTQSTNIGYYIAGGIALSVIISFFTDRYFSDQRYISSSNYSSDYSSINNRFNSFQTQELPSFKDDLLARSNVGLLPYGDWKLMCKDLAYYKDSPSSGKLLPGGRSNMLYGTCKPNLGSQLDLTDCDVNTIKVGKDGFLECQAKPKEPFRFVNLRGISTQKKSSLSKKKKVYGSLIGIIIFAIVFFTFKSSRK